ncbi:MAG: type II toxin-antitoxin system HicB family antitoxin [Moorea sp. SIO2I5]|nr:type II toxin-antitoxin system HicB family antitoxin [Moorena sp. SIO2I5]
MLFKYELIIYWSESDQAFIVEVPELPGCMADGQTYVEAVTNAEVVIKEWIETAQELGRDIPTPKGRLIYA